MTPERVSIRAVVLAAVLASVWSALLVRHDYSLHTFQHAGSWALHDEGAQSLVPLLIVRGKVPYRDFEPRHTPLSYYIFALGYRVLGRDLVSIRWVLAVANVLTAVLSFVWARKAGAGPWAWLALCAALAWGVHEYNVAVPRWLALPASLAAMIALVRNAPTPRGRDVAIAGCWSAVTVLIAQNTGVFLAAACAWTMSAWAFAQDNEGPAAGWASMVPFAGSGIASAVLALLVWTGGVTPPWLLFTLPGICATLALLFVARVRRVSVVVARRLIGHLALYGVALVVPSVLMMAWWASQSGLAPILRSLRAGAGSLQRIYMLHPPPPPDWFAAAVVLWLIAAVALFRRVTTPQSRKRRTLIVASANALAIVVLWTMWLPALPPGGLVAVVIGVSDKLLGLSMMHVMWLIGMAGIVVGFVDIVRGHMTPSRAIVMSAGFATVSSWVHLHPWADYTHILWTAPPTAVTFAGLAHRTVQSLIADGGGLGRLGRSAVRASFALLPATYAVAMLVKWGGYFLDYPLSLQRHEPIVRQFRILDDQTGHIYVERQVQQDWADLLAYIRKNTTPDDPILGIPYFPLVYVLADRAFPLYDCFWWPDFTGEVRVNQREQLLAAIDAATIPLIVGPVSDETYFSLPVLQKTWPDVWARLQERYERTAVFGPYWVFRPRPRMEAL